MRETKPMIKTDDPEKQCLHGNCVYERNEDSLYCRIHAGIQVSPTREKKNSMYALGETEYLASLSDRVQAHASDPRLHSLRRDIGVLEVVLRNLLEQCSSDAELYLRKDELESLFSRLESMKKTNLDLETKTKELIPKDNVIELALQFLQVVINHLEPLAHMEQVQKAMEKISDDFTELCNKDR